MSGGEDAWPWKSEKGLVVRQSESCGVIDFENAEVVAGIVNDTWFVNVSGTKPYVNMKVMLMPLIYIRQPEYWGMEVVGCLPGIGLPAIGKFTKTLPLDGIRGTKGIEIIGASKNEKIDVPPK